MNALAHSAEFPVPARRGVGGSLFLWLSLLLVAYVLSTGPAVYLVEHQVISYQALEPVYAPLEWLADNCEPVAGFFHWYLGDIWGWHPLYHS